MTTAFSDEEPTNKYLLVVGGPTASGKTGLAIALAQHYQTVVVSADSRQFYAQMSIGNACPSAEELAMVTHYFVADRSIEEPLSAGAYARTALLQLEALFEQHDYVVLAGGSGLFIRALITGLDEFPEVSTAIRQQVDDLFDEVGLDGLLAELAKVDPTYLDEVDQQNPVRLKRALEVYYASGQAYSSFRQNAAPTRSFVPIYLQPHWLREELYARIDERVQHMIAAGLEEEVRSLSAFMSTPALQTVGYQEWNAYFTGEQTLVATIALIQQNSRRYAKRQLTWNRRDAFWKLIPRADVRFAIAYIQLAISEGLSLQQLPAIPTQDSIITFGEVQRMLGFVPFHTKEAVAYTQTVTLKDWAALTDWQLDKVSPLAKTMLLQESVLRTEQSHVYAKVMPDEDRSIFMETGFFVIVKDDLPLKLQQKWAGITAAVFLRWSSENTGLIQ